VEAPPLILSEICLDPEFASTAVAESHAPPSSSSLPFRASFLSSGLPGSSNLRSASFKRSIGTSLGPRDPLARLPLELGQSHILHATCDTSNPTFTNLEPFHLCNARLLTAACSSRYNTSRAFPRPPKWLPTLRSRPSWIDTLLYTLLQHATNMACTSRKTQQRSLN
jgi:hypothetical protein